MACYRQLVEKSDGLGPWYSREHEGILTHPGKVQNVSLEDRFRLSRSARIAWSTAVSRCPFMTADDRLGHGLLARGWHGCAVGAWLSGDVRLTAPGLSGRGRLAVPPALRAPGPRYPVASREAARQPIAPRSLAGLRVVQL
ncbi:hypothetical protein Jiend_41450 [Micromonospora endophytica]|nr:hypothetical protein Jiend_41450 [Micromonospora endophytica]